MIVKKMKGYELEKEVKNSFEDYFNRSEIVYEWNGKEKRFSVLYLRFFEEHMSEFTPFQENPIYEADHNRIELKDIVALVYMIQQFDTNKKRVYINDERQFGSLFEHIHTEGLKEALQFYCENGYLNVSECKDQINN